MGDVKQAARSSGPRVAGNDPPTWIRTMHPADAPAVLAVGRALPQWFTDGGVAKMAVDLPNTVGVVAESDGGIVGFLSWFAHEGVARIGWMGVREEHHRRGIGRSMLECAEVRLAATGARELRVDTLGDSVDYEPYARTRAFYRAMGFTDFERRTTGDPECPEQLTLSKLLEL